MFLVVVLMLFFSLSSFLLLAYGITVDSGY